MVRADRLLERYRPYFTPTHEGAVTLWGVPLWEVEDTILHYGGENVYLAPRRVLVAVEGPTNIPRVPRKKEQS